MPGLSSPPGPTTVTASANPAARRRVRRLYVSLGALLIAATFVLALMSSLWVALFSLGMGSLTFATAALMADAEDGTPALIRDGHLTKSERRVLVFGILGTGVAVVMMFVEIAVGLPQRETAVLAVMIATGAGLVGFLALIRDDAPQLLTERESDRVEQR